VEYHKHINHVGLKQGFQEIQLPNQPNLSFHPKNTVDFLLIPKTFADYPSHHQIF